MAVGREGQREAKQRGVSGKFDGSSSARSASVSWSVALRFGDPRHGTFRYCCCIRRRTRNFRTWRCCVAVADGFRGPGRGRRNEDPLQCVGPPTASRFGPRQLPVRQPIHDYDAPRMGCHKIRCECHRLRSMRLERSVLRHRRATGKAHRRNSSVDPRCEGGFSLRTCSSLKEPQGERRPAKSWSNSCQQRSDVRTCFPKSRCAVSGAGAQRRHSTQTRNAM